MIGPTRRGHPHFLMVPNTSTSCNNRAAYQATSACNLCDKIKGCGKCRAYGLGHSTQSEANTLDDMLTTRACSDMLNPIPSGVGQ